MCWRRDDVLRPQLNKTSGQINLAKERTAAEKSLYFTMDRHAFSVKSAPSRGKLK